MYLWLKAAHIVSVIAWMAGMLYLPRLFVYHASAAPGSPRSETFKTMEARLYRYIMAPAMAATWGFGFALAITGHLIDARWLHAKFALVILMSALHGVMGRWLRDFEHDRNSRSAKFYRIVNEIPAVLVIFIVILAVVKPF
jgi:putative membrane protein